MINCLFEEIFLSKVSYNIFTLLWNKEDCTSYFLKWKVKLFVLLLGSHIMAKILVLFFVGCDCLMKTIINLFFKPFLLLNVNEVSWKVKLHNNKNTPCNLCIPRKKIRYELHFDHIQTDHSLLFCSHWILHQLLAAFFIHPPPQSAAQWPEWETINQQDKVNNADSVFIFLII